ncbi:MAG: ABC transporter ATP-binding protein, partial [Bdellovibrionaceae bacterium]|nr:ABC transporter ATP-binding protein [Pseudobdellovibrionaceae bacterium]
MSTKILDINDLKVHYGPIQAIKGISFHVDEGEIVSLIGANGAGKTSTMRAISGLVAASGSIVFAEKELSKIPSHERILHKISQSPEGRGVFPNLTVRENLLMGAYVIRDKDIINEEMERCYQIFPRLRERMHQPAGTLSGGEQQMLAISRALMSRPKLLLLDEPSLELAPI